MDMKRKLELHAQAVANVVSHTDLSSDVLLAALAKMAAEVDAARDAVLQQIDADVAQHVGG